jgi:signal transduction histidine kinase
MIKNRIFLALFFSILFFVAGFLANSFFQNRKNDIISKTAKIQKEIIERENRSKEISENVFKIYKKNGVKELFSDQNLSKKIRENGVSLFLYINDTLKYWSDNIVQVDNYYNNELAEKKVALLKNGWYIISKDERNGVRVLSFLLIKNEYGYENDYLANDFFGGTEQFGKTDISVKKRKQNVFSGNGDFLFSVRFYKTNISSDIDSVIVFVILITAFVFFLYFLYYIQLKIFQNRKTNNLAILCFIICAVVFRGVVFYLKIPEQLFLSKLFSPFYYANSELLPSFGDLVMNLIVLFIISLLVYRKTHINLDKIKKYKAVSFLMQGVLLVIVFVAFSVISFLIRSLLIDSTISFDLNNIFSINLTSIAGFCIITTLLLSFYFLTSRMVIELFWDKKSFIVLIISLIAILLVVYLFYDNSLFLLITTITTALYITGLWLSRNKGKKSHELSKMIFLLVLASLFCTIFLTKYNNFKENEKRKSLAQRLSSSNDFIAEYLFKGLEKNISSDNYINQSITDSMIDETKLAEYITKKYFNGYWEKYKIQITICGYNDSLSFQPGSNSLKCKDFFNNLISSIGKPSDNKNLFILNYETGGSSYISSINILKDTLKQKTIYIELNSKFIPKGLGYPELLIDKKIFINTDLTNYSYAKYKNAELIDAYGKYFYSTNEEEGSAANDEYVFYNKNGYNHLYYQIDESNSIIISKKNGNFFEIMAVFSYLFFFFVFYTVSYIFISRIPNRNKIILNFKNRLQISMVSVILISFLLIGVVTYFYISKLSENKNNDILTEKTLSILTEIQGKIAEYDSFKPEMESYLSALLSKFSNVFFTDINFYDINGNLISSSRPQIFAEGLVSYKMNTDAYNQLAINKKTFLIQKEKIGKLEYYSAYIPFYNTHNKLVAYLNLPYFAKESELKKELSSFLMAFINIYILLIAITILIALVISGRITRSLNIIRDKIASVKLGGKNEKIYWGKNDEIGSLINEYNRMIDELTLSAELLARSERESAWRDMAKQVAHEIKNPLTPMKLSVQFLQKAWAEDKNEFGDRIEKFTKTLIDQIESLSAIATAFSDFANMPKPIMQNEDIVEIINISADLYKNHQKIEFIIEYEPDRDYKIMADKKQLIRVFNNLISNAVQSIDGENNGIVIVHVTSGDKTIIVSVKDNGCGISDYQKPMIFTPKFSTKTNGMGLGLAMVKSIVETHNGKIWFSSEAGKGTTFSMEFPK